MRSSIVGAAIAACLLLVTACSGGAADAPGDAGAGSWSFTDDRGVTVTLDAPPERVAGLTDVVVSLMHYGVAPVASFGAFRGIGDDERFDGLDVSGVADVGASYGQIDLEALAAADPDVIVTHAYPVDSAGTLDPAQPLYGILDIAQQEALESIAPIIAVTMGGSAADVVDRTAELAVALGGDQSLVDSTGAEYAAAQERLGAAAESSGVLVAVVAAYTADGLWIAKAPDDPSLRMYSDLGMRFFEPGGDQYYWGQLSWENAGQLQADVLLDSQLDEISTADLPAQPTLAPTPAVQAGQVFPWRFSGQDHVGQAGVMNELAGYLEQSRVVLPG